MGKAIVYTIDKDNEVVESFKMDYEAAIGQYWGRPNMKGRYHIIPEGIKCPYKRKSKNLKDIKRKNQTHQEV